MTHLCSSCSVRKQAERLSSQNSKHLLPVIRALQQPITRQVRPRPQLPLAYRYHEATQLEKAKPSGNDIIVSLLPTQVKISPSARRGSH